MEEGDFQPAISVRLTASPEGGDITLVGLDEVLLSGDNAWPQVATVALSTRSLFASPSTFPSDATANWGMPARTNTCLIQPGIPTTSSQGAGVDRDVLNQLPLSGDNAWPEVTTIASSSPNFFASPSTFPSDARTNWGMPAGTSTCLIQPSIPTMSSQGTVVDRDFLNQLILSGDNTWPEVMTVASSSPSFFASASNFPSDATTNWGMPAGTSTCFIQPSIPTTSSQGAAIDRDVLNQLLLSGDNAWPEVTTIASSSPSFFASPSSFPSDATTNWGMAAGTSTCLIQPSIPTTSSQGAAVDRDVMNQLLLSGDNAWPEVTTIASSSPSLFASPSTFPSGARTNWGMPGSTSTCLIQPSIPTTSSQGAAVDRDVMNQLLLSGDNAWPEVTTIASSSPSLFASPSTFPSGARTNSGMPGSTNTCLIQPSISTTSSHGAAFDRDVLNQLLLSGDNVWPEVTTIASSSPSLFASPSTFPSGARTRTNWGMPGSTNTCLIQPSISTTSSRGAAVDRDGLNQPLLSGDNAWLASSSPSFAASPTIFPSDAEATTASLTPSSSDTCGTQTRGASSSTLERVTQALTYIMETRRVYMVAQLWAPTKDDDGGLVLKVTGQPFMLDHDSGRLECLREFSIGYWHPSVGFTNDGSSEGIAGKIRMGRLPEWSPNDRHHIYNAWPRMRYAKYSCVSGVMLLPVFDKGNYSCLGVIEFITLQKHNFTSDVDTICSALQEVNLTTTHVLGSPPTKFNTASYEEAIPEILQVLKAACIIHKLPLAQTWATCAQHGKWGKHHSDENRQYCISTIDVACYVNDPRMQIFHEACSEHHLLPGQGVAGKAFTTNQPCFLPNIGSSSEQEYPLCHHAKIFKLKGAVAIRLRCTRAGMADFVLEFFLPRDCGVLEEQKAVLDSLWGTVRSLFQTLRMVTGKEMEDDALWEMNEINSFDLQNNKKANKRKRMARRSPVWRSFTEVMVGDNVKAKCNHCGLELCCHSKTHGTSSLKSHLERCKLNPSNRTTGPL